MSDGRSVEVTTDHRFWNGAAWIRAEQLRQGDRVAVASRSSNNLPVSSSGVSLSGSLRDVRHLMRTIQDLTGRYWICRHQHDAQPHRAGFPAQAFRASLSGGLERILAYLLPEWRGSDIHMGRQLQRAATRILDGPLSFHLSMTGGFPCSYHAAGFSGRASEQISGWFRGTRSILRQSQLQIDPLLSAAGLDHGDQGLCGHSVSVSSDTPCESGYKLSRIVRITETAVQDYYTLHVPGCEHYFANGVLHHNSGKTVELVGTVIERALLAPKSRHLIVRQEGTSAKRAIVKGTWPEVMEMRWPGLKYEWKEQYGYFRLENGSEVWVGGLNDEKALEKILGNEYATIYVNEGSEVRYSAFTLLRSRLAQTATTISGKSLSQRIYVDLNPTTRQHWTYRLWIDGVDPESQLPVDADQYGHVVVNPLDNAENLSQEYLDDLRSLPPRARKRFMDGQYVEDVEDALWRRSVIRRVAQPPPLKRIVVAIDPAVTNKPGSDETGIVAAGVDEHGNGYVLDDASGRFRPEDWARRAIAVYHTMQADRIVAEVNQGGDMVESTIRAVNRNVPYRGVRASRGKLIRAEPIAALYERGKVFHCGEFPELEDQMASFTTGFDAKAAGYSPDRVDALVWALTDLFPELSKRRDDDTYEEHDDAQGYNETTGY